MYTLSVTLYKRSTVSEYFSTIAKTRFWCTTVDKGKKREQNVSQASMN